MTTTTTPRLKLLVDSLGETNIGTNSANWDIVDNATGVIYTNKGVNVPNSQLYDGAFVAERDTGISWICKDNGAGGYNKQYVTYPYLFVAFSSGVNIPATNPLTARGWNTFHPASAINSSAAQLVNNSWVCPVKGLYSVTSMIRVPTVSGGHRGGYLSINGSPQLDTEMMQGPFVALWDTTTLTPRFQRVLNVGDVVVHMLTNSSNNSLTNCYFSVNIEMIRPVI